MKRTARSSKKPSVAAAKPIKKTKRSREEKSYPTEGEWKIVKITVPEGVVIDLTKDDGPQQKGYIKNDVVKTVFDNGASRIYTGSTLFGKFHGQGEAVITQPNGKTWSFSGKYINGLPHGEGKRIDVNGNYAIGEFLGSIPHGKIKIYDVNDKLFYEGDMVCGRRHGEGTQYGLNGEVHVGEWFDNKQHGKGFIYGSADGKIIKEGEWFAGNFLPSRKK